MRCTANNVILAIGEAKEMSDGGVFIPEAARKSESEYEVVMVGPEVDIGIQIGDIVLKPEVTILASKRGREFDLEVEGRKCIVVEDEDIRVVLSDGAQI